MIMKKYFAGWKKYILTFVFAVFMLLCFAPQRIQAAITREVTQDGLKLSGSGTMDVQSGNAFSYYLGYQIPSEESMDYRVDDPYVLDPLRDASKYSVSISDPSVAKVTGITPGSGDSADVSVYFYKAGSADLIFKYGNQTKKISFTVSKTVITVASSISLKVGDTTMFSSYVFKTGGGSVTIKKVKSSNKKIVDAAGGFIIAKKPGTAKVSALVNGKRRTITVIVGKKSAPKPTLKQLQVKVTGYKYYPTSGKTYYRTKFTNKSKSTITKVKLKFTMIINEQMTRTKTFTVNIKPGKTKTLNLNIGKLISNPSNIKAKCLNLWYKR